ncbi:hypothetical protein B0J13DRAFT_539523 [Dactylonectria estremocensis]|uniref:Very-long-chain 3-oxoacyl-CoA synthase n=1 Tax=Dactylonectria estremocensis TaxID=1079267 RepID=A0A9P9JI13_9HYPO|nr:hypothetical protein B0J13DRAFT_539523 [Dactylonectria estremocensis]
MESFRDGWAFQGTSFMVCQTLLFVAAWKGVDFYVSRHGPIARARKFTLLNSWIYSAASFALMILIASPSLEKTARGLYHASKFWEYVDVLGVRAGGGLIDLHFAFHHLTTPYLSYVRVILHSDGWRVLAILNTLHHGLMYAYFGGAGLLRPALEVTGTAQLVVGIGGEAWMLWKRLGKADEVVWPHAVGLGLLSAYLVLWVRDVRKRRQQHVGDGVQNQLSTKEE